MVLRSDPSCATGYAPGELLLGRKLVYPIELEKSEVDLTGNFYCSISACKNKNSNTNGKTFFCDHLYS